MISTQQRMGISAFTAITSRKTLTGLGRRRTLHRNRYLKAGSLDFLRAYFGGRFASAPAQPFTEEKVYRQPGRFWQNTSTKSPAQFFMSLDFTGLAQSLQSFFHRHASPQNHFWSQFLNVDKRDQSTATMRAETIQIIASALTSLPFTSPRVSSRRQPALLPELRSGGRLAAALPTPGPLSPLQITKRQNFERQTFTYQGAAADRFERSISRRTTSAGPTPTGYRLERLPLGLSVLERVFALSKLAERGLPHPQTHSDGRTSFTQKVAYLLISPIGRIRLMGQMGPTRNMKGKPHPFESVRRPDSQMTFWQKGTDVLNRSFLQSSLVRKQELSRISTEIDSREIDSRQINSIFTPLAQVFGSIINRQLFLRSHLDAAGQRRKSAGIRDTFIRNSLRTAYSMREIFKAVDHVGATGVRVPTSVESFPSNIDTRSAPGTPLLLPGYSFIANRPVRRNDLTATGPAMVAGQALWFWQTKFPAVVNYSRRLLARSLSASTLFGARLLKQFTFMPAETYTAATPRMTFKLSSAGGISPPNSPAEFVSVRPQPPARSAERVEMKLETREILELVKNQVKKSLTNVMSPRNFSSEDYADLSDRVYSLLTRRLTVERERLGLR